MRFLSVTFAALLFLTPAHAEMPAGADDPAFVKARAAWLAGDDRVHASLYKLAEKGNAAALILYRRLLPRNPDVGPALDDNWLDYANDSELAKAFNFLRRGNGLSREAHILELFRVGEPVYASWLAMDMLDFSRGEKPLVLSNVTGKKLVGKSLPPIIRFMNFFKFQVREAFDQQLLLEEFAAFCREVISGTVKHPVFMAWCKAGSDYDTAMTIALYSAFLTGDQTQDPEGRGKAFLENWIRTDTSLQYTRLCRAVCPEETVQCGQFLFRHNARLIGLSRFVTPTETLISQQDYLQSPRAVRDVWDRFVADYTSLKELDPKYKPRAGGRCLVKALNAGVDPLKKD